jgi:hypothetical protein
MTNIQQLATVDKLIEDNQALREEVAAVWEMVEQAKFVLNMAIRNRRKARLTKPQRGFAMSRSTQPWQTNPATGEDIEVALSFDELMDNLMNVAARVARALDMQNQGVFDSVEHAEAVSEYLIYEAPVEIAEARFELAVHFEIEPEGGNWTVPPNTWK